MSLQICLWLSLFTKCTIDYESVLLKLGESYLSPYRNDKQNLLIRQWHMPLY